MVVSFNTCKQKYVGMVTNVKRRNANLGIRSLILDKVNVNVYEKKKTDFQVLVRTRRMQIHSLKTIFSRWEEEQGLR